MSIAARLTPIPYYANSADWFMQIRKFEMPIWLDSGHPKSIYGRFDIMSAAPATIITTLDKITSVRSHGQSQRSTENPFALLRTYLTRNQPNLVEVPFC